MYTFKWLNKKLLLIIWSRTPSSDVTLEFISELQKILDNADEPIYLISDLRKGRIIDVRLLSKLGALTQHKNMTGSTAFCKNMVSNMFATTFQKLPVVHDERHQIFDQPEDAIRFLESLEVGLTADINWLEVIGGSAKR